MRPWQGAFHSRAAVFHDGLGCVLLHGAKEPYLLRSDIDALKAPKTPPLLPEIAGPDSSSRPIPR